MQEKVERNKAFWLSWKRDNLTPQQLSEKYHITINTVRKLKEVLKIRGYDENGEPMKERPRFFGTNRGEFDVKR